MSEPQLYNFGKPAPLTAEVDQRLQGWLRTAAALAAKKAVRHLPFSVEVVFSGLEVHWPADGLAVLPDAAVGYGLSANTDIPTTLLALPRNLVLALVGGMLGDVASALPEDRELTEVEDSLCQFFVQDVLVTTLQETWPAAETIPFKLRRRELHPKWTRIFPPEENTLVCAFTIRAPLGESGWLVLFPQKQLLELLARTGPGKDRPKPVSTGLPDKERLRQLVEELPVDLTVVLGTVELTLGELARLMVGDVIILDQRVSDPLPAFLANEKKCRGWPGRVGSRQAIEIHSFVGS
jgi:flagellar motor switch protein FliM